MIFHGWPPATCFRATIIDCLENNGVGWNLVLLGTISLDFCEIIGFFEGIFTTEARRHGGTEVET